MDSDRGARKRHNETSTEILLPRDASEDGIWNMTGRVAVCLLPRGRQGRQTFPRILTGRLVRNVARLLHGISEYVKGRCQPRYSHFMDSGKETLNLVKPAELKAEVLASWVTATQDHRTSLPLHFPCITNFPLTTCDLLHLSTSPLLQPVSSTYFSVWHHLLQANCILQILSPSSLKLPAARVRVRPQSQFSHLCVRLHQVEQSSHITTIRLPSRWPSQMGTPWRWQSITTASPSSMSALQ